jgi:hypothetical protein
MNRRWFLKTGTGLAAASLSPWLGAAELRAPAPGPAIELLPTTQKNRSGFFTLGRASGRTWLISPRGALFLTIGKNHIDPAALRYAESGDRWFRKYGNSVERWLKEKVRPDLEAWGFNSVGWNQDMASNGVTNHRQSRLFTFAEHQWLGLPYAPMLPFADFHHWDAQTRLPDFHAPEFADWCDYVAREYVAPAAQDPKLIGYFYVDCPVWVHTHPHSRWRGALFDYRKLGSEAGRRELTDLATKYYQTCHDAIRRYDPNHLILGDRYEGKGRMAVEVLQAAGPFVDVISFQHFGTPEQVVTDLNGWAQRVGKPVLLADSYSGSAAVMQGIPDCIGYHACGSYTQNKIRGEALLDMEERPIGGAVEKARQTNREAQAWARSLGAE